MFRMSDAREVPNASGHEGSTTYTRNPMESGGIGRNQPQPPQAGASSSPAGPDRTHGMTDEATPAGTALIEAREQERIRLAEELHDGTAQALANALFQIEIVERALRAHPQEAAAELSALRTILERELETLRGYINQLRPSLGEPTSLDDALRDTVDALAERSSVSVEVQLEAPADELHQAARTTVLRVAQEALRNVVKHAGASHAWLITRKEARGGHDYWVLEVRDDGVGFDIADVTAHADRRHFGLRFMRERAELLGSELVIESNRTSGTVVRLSIDLGEDRR
jgi:two-component system sensor histidine kinase DegS